MTANPKPAEGLPDALLTATTLREHQFTNDATYKGCSCGQLNNYGVITEARWTQWAEHVALLLAPLASARIAAALREAADETLKWSLYDTNTARSQVLCERLTLKISEAILALIPAPAQAALDAVVAQAVRKARLDALEDAAKAAEKWALHYPVDIFRPLDDETPNDDKTALLITRASGAMGRQSAKCIAEDIRNLAEPEKP